MRTDELDFHLPEHLIAQTPSPERSASRLLHYREGRIEHRVFSDLPGLLREGDVLVFNDAKVNQARFNLRKVTGGLVEGLFLEAHGEEWSVLLRNIAGAKPGARFVFENDSAARVELVDRKEEGICRIRVRRGGGAIEDVEGFLERIGRMPLPPYIRRDKVVDDRDDLDRERYQTVYAKVGGSVAAPTAGLHFTPAVLQELDARGIERVTLTLHVGMGTFKPVVSETVEGHTMHVERYSLPERTCEVINRAKREGRRIVAVGTTTARVLESQPEGELAPTTAETGIFIFPPYRWRHVGALITNFHLPRSTLIALVAAKVGMEAQRRIYAEAIREGYRFFSYGDASLLEG